MTLFQDLLHGFNFPFSAFSIIKAHPQLRRVVVVPLAINVLLFTVGFTLLWIFRVNLIELVWAYPPDGWYLQGMWYIMGSALFAVTLLLAYFLFTPIGCLIASPFNDALAGRTEQALDPEVPEEDLPVSFAAIALTLRKELAKLMVMGLILLVGLLLNLIPGLGSLLSIGVTVGAGSWFLAIEYLDYPMSRHGYAFSEIVHFTNRRRWLCVGFGAGAMLLLIVPFLNLVCIPACVVGATALMVETRSLNALDPPAAKFKE